jgi:membrane protein DedA with SNARE-associated domain
MSYLVDHLTRLLEQYGYVVLFLSLFLEMLALPLPGEFIMTYAGLIVYQGKLDWFLSIMTGGIGASLGMTIAYWVGFRLGNPFFEKYGSRIHFGPDKLHSVSKWFGRYGNKMLIIAFFIPGVRHITGYFSGTTRLSFRKYAAFAYTGAFFWVSVFISLGRLLGPKWEQYHSTINLYMLIFGLISVIAYILIIQYRKNKQRIRQYIDKWLEKGLHKYHSVGKVKFIILIAGALFGGFFTLMIGLIEDFLAHEFTQFDEIASYLVWQIFGTNWTVSMNHWALFSSYSILLPLIVLTSFWVLFKANDRLLTIAFFAVVVVGGEGLEEGLRRLFHLIGPSGGQLTFPSEQALMVLTVYGFTAYLLIRHHGNYLIRIMVVLTVSVICLMTGISVIYLGTQYPSDVVAGYVFGGMWISLNVVLLEIFREMRRSQPIMA